MTLSNSYHSLGDDFFEATSPTPARAPKLLLWNEALANELGIAELLEDSNVEGDSKERGGDLATTHSQVLAEIFAGNTLLPGSEPLSMAYAGHQFGYFVPQLGDGRAHLLGERAGADGQVFDVQLKGSGQTYFSRRGDGRCALGPAVREFIMSEAMDALGVPTARSLAVVSTGEIVMREMPGLGGIVTRVAASHLRVGTFQYFAARRNVEALTTLCKFAAERHYPELKGTESELAIQLLDKVIERQIHLVTEWMRVGFIHGVMNTDNTTISGETIDYGPCAMMGIYDPKTVHSSVDVHGRYAFGNQPNIMQWNMARFAECLIPFLNEDEDTAVEMATARIQKIADELKTAWLSMTGRKLGLATSEANDEELIDQLLKILEDEVLDYTVVFNQLTLSLRDKDIATQLEGALGKTWLESWQQRASQQLNHPEDTYTLMRRTNPVVVPRNHQVEAAIKDMNENLSSETAEQFLKVLRSPYEDSPESKPYQVPPADGDRHYQTFCGT